MEDLIILGAGGFAREASLLVEEINFLSQQGQRFNLLGFIDTKEKQQGLVLRGYPVLGGWEALEDITKECRLICVIGDPVVKKKMVVKARSLGFDFTNLIHPSVYLASDVRVGSGVLINRGCQLTINIDIGDHVSINPGCGIGHDTSIGSYTTLMWRVNLSGNVKVGEGCLIGTGAVMLQKLAIGSGVTVGAGAVVTKGFPDECTVVGVPARVEEHFIFGVPARKEE